MAVKPAVNAADDLRNQLRTLDSKINLLAERLKTAESNSEIAGRTLLALKDQVKKPAASEKNASASSGLDSLESDVKGLKADVKDLKNQVEQVKYVLDSINPLEFATLDQVRDLVDEKLKKK